MVQEWFFLDLYRMSYKHEPHKNGKLTRSFNYCVKCGLIYLKNYISQQCIKLGCEYDEHATVLNWKKNG